MRAGQEALGGTETDGGGRADEVQAGNRGLAGARQHGESVQRLDLRPQLSGQEAEIADVDAEARAGDHMVDLNGLTLAVEFKAHPGSMRLGLDDLTARQHLDASQILRRSRKLDSRIDRVTVYRTLLLLKRHSLVDELDLMHLRGDGHFYERRPPRDHLHMACLRCGKVKEFESNLFERLKGEVQRQCRFQILITRLEMGGYCAHCRALTPSAEIQKARAHTENSGTRSKAS